MNENVDDDGQNIPFTNNNSNDDDDDGTTDLN